MHGPQMRPNVIFAVAITTLIAASFTCAAQQQAGAPSTPDLAALEKTLVNVIARAEPSVVAITRRSGDQVPLVLRGVPDVLQDLRAQQEIQGTPEAIGSGVVIDPAGLILTQYLVVREGDVHTVTTANGQSYEATIKAADPRSGLAVLSVAARDLPALRLGDAAQLRKGQFVVAIGNPQSILTDGQPTGSFGIVANLARKAGPHVNLNDAPGAESDYRTTLHHLGTLIQTDAKLALSTSGGALVNLRGELVGLTISSAVIDGHEEAAGYAIPINATIRRVIETLADGREAEYGLLGVGVRGEVPGQGEPPNGVAVERVVAGTPAAQAGLMAGDVITHVSDRPINDIDALLLNVGSFAPGQRATVRFVRGERSASVPVVLSKSHVDGNVVATNRSPVWRGIRVDYATAAEPAALEEGMDPSGCVAIVAVEPESPAWRAGIRPGMFISHAGGKRVTTPEEFRAAVAGNDETLTIRLTHPIARADENGDSAKDSQESAIPAKN